MFKKKKRNNTKFSKVFDQRNQQTLDNHFLGQILWRRVLEQGCAGRVQALGGITDGDLVTVSGAVPAIVRAWDLATGHIINEWPLAEQNQERFVFEFLYELWSS